MNTNLDVDTINNYFKRKQSSCYFLDLRNSTRVIRKISLKYDEKDNDSTERLKKHSQFMLDVHKELEAKVNIIKTDEFFFNDTGDGHLCLFWDNSHAWRALDVACHMHSFLNERLKSYNKTISSWFPELTLSFGIGLHTGGSLIYRKKYLIRLPEWKVIPRILKMSTCYSVEIFIISLSANWLPLVFKV